MVNDKYYENDHRTNPISFGSYNKPKYIDSSVLIIDKNIGKGIVTVNRKAAVMNEKVHIITQIIQLITKYFNAVLHIQRNRKRSPMDKMGYERLKNHEKNFIGWYPRCVFQTTLKSINQ